MVCGKTSNGFSVSPSVVGIRYNLPKSDVGFINSKCNYKNNKLLVENM
jgi:hypothetical protein